MVHNYSGVTQAYATIRQPADMLNLHPAPDGTQSVVRWTAPVSGAVTITGRFEGLDVQGTTTDVSVWQTIKKTGSSAVFSGSLNGYGQQAGFALRRSVQAGDTLEFRVGVGANGTYYYDSTGLAVTLTLEGAGSGGEITWVVTDPLGTPRMIADLTGSLAGIKRHDYLPFGEELYAGVGGRTAQQGYNGNADGNRKRWAQLERDDETGLDYAQARYYSPTMGRFTSPDEFNGGPVELFTTTASANPTFYADLTNPQSLNKYQYTYNNPLNMVDPNGHCPDCPGLIIITPETTRTAIDVLKGVRNALDNIAKDINNTNAEFGVGGATYDGSYREPENMAQAVGQVVADRVLTFGGLLGGKSPAGVMTAEAKTTGVVAAEAGALRATKNGGQLLLPIPR